MKRTVVLAIIVFGLVVVLVAFMTSCTTEESPEPATDTPPQTVTEAPEPIEQETCCAKEAFTAQVTRLTIKDLGNREYKIICDRTGSDCRTPRALPGDWVAWTSDLADEQVVLHFFRRTADNSRDLRLFGSENRKIVVRKGKWTYMRVQEYADVLIEHRYRVQGYQFNDPPPGLIVCPPNDPNCSG